jgi:NOL1/NOP2/fmu family ribosome biogenesis protein
MAMGKDFKRKIELNSKDDEVLKYLHGEEISASVDNGWAVVTVDGCSLGGAKVTNSRGKNHYPKGLRV